MARKLTVDERIEMARYADEHGSTAAMHKYGVTRPTVNAARRALKQGMLVKRDSRPELHPSIKMFLVLTT